jgi:hypothetical protein
MLPPAAKAPLLPSQYPYPHNYPPPAQASQEPTPPLQDQQQQQQQQQPPQPPPNAWGRQRVSAPQAQPTGFPDQSVTTTVVPNNDPTTQTTLKKRSSWVRGGYD